MITPTIKAMPTTHAPTPTPSGLSDFSDSETSVTLMQVKDFSFFYGKKQALYSINMEIPMNQVTAFIGPSGCGKTTLLRNFNRMNDLVSTARRTGDILMAGRSIFDRKLKLINVRRSIGMVFQKSNPFPRSISQPSHRAESRG